MVGPLRVLVVEDHEMFSEALALLFGRQPGIELVAALPAGEEAVARCRDETPDVVLMDVDLPGIDGIEATRRIRMASPSTKVVVLTAMENPSLIVSAMAAAACGYMSKTPPAGRSGANTGTVARGTCRFEHQHEGPGSPRGLCTFRDQDCGLFAIANRAPARARTVPRPDSQGARGASTSCPTEPTRQNPS